MSKQTFIEAYKKVSSGVSTSEKFKTKSFLSNKFISENPEYKNSRKYFCILGEVTSSESSKDVSSINISVTLRDELFYQVLRELVTIKKHNFPGSLNIITGDQFNQETYTWKELSFIDLQNIINTIGTLFDTEKGTKSLLETLNIVFNSNENKEQEEEKIEEDDNKEETKNSLEDLFNELGKLKETISSSVSKGGKVSQDKINESIGTIKNLFNELKEDFRDEEEKQTKKSKKSQRKEIETFVVEIDFNEKVGKDVDLTAIYDVDNKRYKVHAIYDVDNKRYKVHTTSIKNKKNVMDTFLETFFRKFR